jgi:hypothetical protein
MAEQPQAFDAPWQEIRFGRAIHHDEVTSAGRPNRSSTWATVAPGATQGYPW